MFDLIGKTVAMLFGSKSERDIKEVMPYVVQTNIEFAKLASISDDELRQRTETVKERIAEHLRPIDEQIAALHTRVQKETELDISQKEDLFSEIDELEKSRNKELEVVLLEVLPQAFAIVKETARRYKENPETGSYRHRTGPRNLPPAKPTWKLKATKLSGITNGWLPAPK